LNRWRIQRLALSPEGAGLCGCWQFIAVWRQRQILRKGKVVEETEEYSFYVTSLAHDEYSGQELLEMIRGHWSACEIGSHYRRDVSLGEDASLIAGRTRAFVMATLRNLVLGLFELQKRDASNTPSYVPGWRRRMSGSQALRLLTQ
jgi:hypothetical protein